MDVRRIAIADMDWTEGAPGSRAKAIERSGFRLRVVEFSEEFVEPDWCTRAHAGYVLDGRCEIDFDGDVESFGPGDALIIPRGDRHKLSVRVGGLVRLVLFEFSDP